MLNTDLEVGGSFPPVVEAFRKRILETDIVLFASPEYNYSIIGKPLPLLSNHMLRTWLDRWL
uniref:NAD(P)H dehydrogenase (quinone) n=1 Tax=Rhizophora mucronata TaxID=61149 RepID=A0A2P2K8V0_RHIMU